MVNRLWRHALTTTVNKSIPSTIINGSILTANPKELCCMRSCSRRMLLLSTLILNDSGMLLMQLKRRLTHKLPDA